MAVLVVGGGLVGSQIARVLLERGKTPIIFDRIPQPQALGGIVDLSRITLLQGDVLRPWDLVSALRKGGIEGIIHTAAYPMLTAGAQLHPYDAIEVNIMGAANILEAAVAFGVPRVVIASSSVLSSHVSGGEDAGNQAMEEAFPRPITFYAATKQAVESLGDNYARWKGIDVRMVRYAAVAGPWTGVGGGEPTNVFRAMVEGALKHGKADIPNVKIEWIYSRDAGLGTVLALEAKIDRHRVFNLSMGAPTSPEDMAAAIQAAIPGIETRIGPKIGTATMGGATFDEPLELGRAKSILGYQPAYPMTEAIRDYADWLKSLAKN